MKRSKKLSNFRIEIEGDYHVLVDDRNYALRHKKRIIGYYGTLKKALIAYIKDDFVMKNINKVYEVEEYIKLLEEKEGKLEEIVEKLNVDIGKLRN